MNILNSIRNRKYLKRIFFLVMIAILLSVCIFSVILGHKIESNLLQSEYDNNIKVLSQMEYNINSMIETVNNLGFSLFYSADVITMMYGKNNKIEDLALYINRLNSSILNSNDYVLSIYVYNNFEKKYYSTLNRLYIDDSNLNVLIDSYNKMPPKLVPLPRESPFLTGSSTDNNKIFSFFYYDDLESKEQMNGALILNIKSDWIYNNIELINAIGGESKGEILIFDNNEDYIDFGNTEKYGGNAEFKQKLMSDYEKQGNTQPDLGYFTSTINSKPYLVTYLKIKKTGWVLMNIQDHSEVYRDIYELRNYIFYIVLIFLAFGLIVSATISGGIYRPIGKLINKYGFKIEGEEECVKNKGEIAFLNSIYKDYSDQLNQYKQEKDQNKGILKKYFLKQLLINSTSFTDSELNENITKYNLTIFENKLAICLIKINSVPASGKSEDSEIVNFTINNIANKIISKQYKTEPIDISSEYITILIGIEDNSKRYIENFNKIANEIIEYCNDKFQIGLSIISSRTAKSARSLSKEYNNAVNLSRYSFIFGNGAVITAESVEKNIGNLSITYANNLEKEFIKGIKTGNIKYAKNILSKIIAEISDLSYTNAILSLIRLTYTYYKAVEEINSSSINPVSIDIKTIIESINENGTMKDFERNLIYAIESVNSQTKEKENMKYEILIHAIKEIIHSSYYDPSICSAQIASMLKISTFHLRKTFRQYTNMSVSEYLNNIRMEKAIELFTDTSFSVGKVIKKIGIENESYFYKLFKKKFGTTPKQYILNKAIKKIDN